jgi:hypothetical protein
MTAVLLGALLVAGSPGFAQVPVTIGFYGDDGGTECALSHVTQFFMDVHIWVVGGTEVSAVGFYAPTPACWDAAWLADNFAPGILYLGGTHDEVHGVTAFVGLNACESTPVYLGLMRFFGAGPTGTCCEYRPLPRPDGSVSVTWYDCEEIAFDADASALIVNPDETCMCGGPVETRDSTWSQVKALYR